MFRIKVYNQASVDGYASLAVNPSAKTVLDSNIDAIMTDESNGDYTYSFSTNTSGPVTIAVYLDNSPGVFVEWYNNWNLVGSTNHLQTVSSIDHNWGSSSLPNGMTDCTSAIYYGNLLFPSSALYTFHLEHDDGSILTIGGDQLFNEWDKR